MKLRNLQSVQSQSKFVLVVIAVMACVVSGFAQTTNIAVAPGKMNVLYIGVDNPVSIAASGAADDKITVSINGGGGYITKMSAGNYVVRVSEFTDNCLIQVDVDGKSVGTSTFRVRALPAPSATIGGYFSGSNVPFNSFNNQAGVGLYLQDFPFFFKFELVSFTMIIDDTRGTIKEFQCEGSRFSEEAASYIKEYVKRGFKVTINDIVAKDESGMKKTIASLVYYIK